jgi:hypothetical protein
MRGQSRPFVPSLSILSYRHNLPTIKKSKTQKKKSNHAAGKLDEQNEACFTHICSSKPDSQDAGEMLRY